MPPCEHFNFGRKTIIDHEGVGERTYGVQPAEWNYLLVQGAVIKYQLKRIFLVHLWMEGNKTLEDAVLLNQYQVLIISSCNSRPHSKLDLEIMLRINKASLTTSRNLEYGSALRPLNWAVWEFWGWQCGYHLSVIPFICFIPSHKEKLQTKARMSCVKINYMYEWTVRIREIRQQR